VLPYFAPEIKDPTAENVVKYLDINQRVRKENGQVFYGLRTDTSPEKLWEGTWLSLKNAATMSRFGDKRLYYYKGKVIDEQIHMGVDLASLAGSKVGAANNGRIIFADRLGIYGLTVVIDHGQGLASTYSHLSSISVKPGQDRRQGRCHRLTGQTGLAGGDHLHFGVMVSGFFVNPIEWWDAHWIKDNVTRKLKDIKVAAINLPFQHFHFSKSCVNQGGGMWKWHFDSRRFFCTFLIFLIPAATVRAENPLILYILDGSGSMWGRVEGKIKIQAAKEVMTTLLKETPESIDCGIMVYGHRKKGGLRRH
jgi:hypothetical protein